MDKAPDSVLCGDAYMFSRTLDPAEAAERIRGLDVLVWQDRFPEGLRKLASAMGLPPPKPVAFGLGDAPDSAESLLNNHSFVSRAMERLAPSLELMRLLGRPELASPETAHASLAPR
jgi:hypothetical protein